MRASLLLAAGLAAFSSASPLAPSHIVRSPATKPFATIPPSSTSTDPHDQFDPTSVKDVTCDANINIAKSSQQIAELLVCNGIQAPITNCGGNLKSTTATSGNAKWTLTAPAGATLNFFKGSWEQCANAARAACPNQTFTGTCLGGVTSGAGFTFQLSKA